MSYAKRSTALALLVTMLVACGGPEIESTSQVKAEPSNPPPKTVQMYDRQLKLIEVDPSQISRARVIHIERPGVSEITDLAGSLARVGYVVGGRSYLHQNLVMVADVRDPRNPDAAPQVVTRALGWQDNADDNNLAMNSADVQGYSGSRIAWISSPKVIGRGVLPADRLTDLVPQLIDQSETRWRTRDTMAENGETAFGNPEIWAYPPIYETADKVDEFGTIPDGDDCTYFNCQTQSAKAFKDVVLAVDPEGRQLNSIQWEQLSTPE